MSQENVDALQIVYEEWGRGNFRPTFNVYGPDMEWGWSEEFPDVHGVFRDPELKAAGMLRVAGPVGGLAHRGRGVHLGGQLRRRAVSIHGAWQGERGHRGYGRGTRQDNARGQGDPAGDLLQSQQGPRSR